MKKRSLYEIEATVRDAVIDQFRPLEMEKIDEAVNATKDALDALHARPLQVFAGKRQDVIQLHLALDIDGISEEALAILRKYGDMKAGITRDVLVPGEMTLHALHYAIQRAFNLTNSHLHHFYLPDDVNDALTGGRFGKWMTLAGVYFRFPTEDMEDLYWDDDYTGSQNFKTWLKKKYTGPYRYEGFSEHNLFVREMVQDIITTMPVLKIQTGRKKKGYQTRIEDASMKAIRRATHLDHDELLERLPLSQLFLAPGEEPVPLGTIADQVAQAHAPVNLEYALATFEETNFPSFKKEDEYLASYNIQITPVTQELRYYYDNWEVGISCEAAYSNEAGWKDSHGAVADEALCAQLDEVTGKLRPLCISKDGIELIDEMGGIEGFAQALAIIKDIASDEDEREDLLAYAAEQGWHNRRIAPQRTL